jgi:CheY-like chemotaxis protein
MNKVKILVADNEPVVLEYMRFVLEHWGYQVILANDGKEAIEKALTEIPDIALLDLHMPVMDGTEACAKLKEDPRTSDIIVIFASGSQLKDLDEDISRYGAKGLISKPFNFEMLQNILKQALEEKK